MCFNDEYNRRGVNSSLLLLLFFYGNDLIYFLYFFYREIEGIENEDGETPKPKPTTSASTTVLPQIGEDGNVLSNVTQVTQVVGRVGNLFGKGIGGLSSKLGGGGWF